MTLPANPVRAAAADLIRQAFDFATRHTEHPLARILSSKAAELSRGAPDEAGLLEMRLLLAQAEASTRS